MALTALVAFAISFTMSLKPKVDFLNIGDSSTMAWHLTVTFGDYRNIRLQAHDKEFTLYVHVPYHTQGSYLINQDGKLLTWQPFTRR